MLPSLRWENSSQPKFTTEHVRRLGSIGALLALASMSCGKPKPTIILDGWWSADYAREACARARTYLDDNAALISSVGCPAVTACKEMTAQASACTVNPELKVRQFEHELAAEFAANPLCHGLRFDTFDFPDTKTALEMKDSSHWTLMLDFQPGADRQSWNVSRGPQASIFVEGAGNPKEVAAKVCAVVTQRGAEMLE